MAITINTNVAAINAQRNLSKTQGSLNSSLQRLSSGLRINSGADDAAGLAISEKLKAQIRSLAQAERNAQDGISLLQTADGALAQVGDIVIRLRELAIQATNDTIGDTERGFLDSECHELVEEVDRIGQVTEFNGSKLLYNGASGAITDFVFQVGINNTSSDRLHVNMGTAFALFGMVHGAVVGASVIAVSTIADARDFIDTMDAIQEIVSALRSGLGAKQNRLNVTIANLATARENLSAANSRIRDVDVAEETANLTRSQILMQAGVSVLAQANQVPSLALSLMG